LSAAHDLADHLVQTDRQAAEKSRDWRAMAGHVGGYTLTQAVALAGLHAAGVALRPGRAVAGLGLSAATHAFLDRRWPVAWLLEATGSSKFAASGVAEQRAPAREGVAVVPGFAAQVSGPHVADQALHHVCLALAAVVVAG
jgi:hypothetical protein